MRWSLCCHTCSPPKPPQRAASLTRCRSAHHRVNSVCLAHRILIWTHSKMYTQRVLSKELPHKLVHKKQPFSNYRIQRVCQEKMRLCYILFVIVKSLKEPLVDRRFQYVDTLQLFIFCKFTCFQFLQRVYPLLFQIKYYYLAFRAVFFQKVPNRSSYSILHLGDNNYFIRNISRCTSSYGSITDQDTCH